MPSQSLAGHEVPGEADRVALEVVAEAEVAEHLEERVVPRGVADVLEVVVLAAGAHAALRARRAGVVALLLAQEHVLELHHAGVREQQRRVVAGHERARRHDRVAALAEKFQEQRAQLGARQALGGRHESGWSDVRPSRVDVRRRASVLARVSVTKPGGTDLLGIEAAILKEARLLCTLAQAARRARRRTCAGGPRAASCTQSTSARRSASSTCDVGNALLPQLGPDAHRALAALRVVMHEAGGEALVARPAASPASFSTTRLDGLRRDSPCRASLRRSSSMECSRRASSRTAAASTALASLLPSAGRRSGSDGRLDRFSRLTLQRLAALLLACAWPAAASRGSCPRSPGRSPGCCSRKVRAFSLPWPMRSPL